MTPAEAAFAAAHSAHFSLAARQDQYHCLDCDVYGKGVVCWSCGLEDYLTVEHVEGWTNWHRHDLSLREVLVGNGYIKIRREVNTLLLDSQLKAS